MFHVSQTTGGNYSSYHWRSPVDLLEHIPRALEKSVRFDRPGKEKLRITVFDVVELRVRHLEEHIESIKAIRQSHNV